MEKNIKKRMYICITESLCCIAEINTTLQINYISIKKIKEQVEPRYSLLLLKGKRKITYKRTPIRLTAEFSAETLQARREWHDILKVMKRKNLQPRLLYPARISFRFDGEIKSFKDKQKLRAFSTTNQLYNKC